MTIQPTTDAQQPDIAAVAERVADGRERILAEIRKVIVGQDEVIDQVLMALFTGGHCLITGVPGLAKTLLIKTRRADPRSVVQADPVHARPDAGRHHRHRGARRGQDGHRALRFVNGPIFAQIILADEINRTPPKTQAALLEAMQEYHVTAAGRTYPLERPFFVLATQNPIELEGTYPLPEAQLDRFMFNIVMTYLAGRRGGPRRHADDRRDDAHAVAGAERRRDPRDPAAGAAGRSSPRRSRATRCGWSTRRGPGRQGDHAVRDASG